MDGKLVFFSQLSISESSLYGFLLLNITSLWHRPPPPPQTAQEVRTTALFTADSTAHSSSNWTEGQFRHRPPGDFAIRRAVG